MLTRRIVMLGVAGTAIATPVRAADAAALAFVTEIYNSYKGKNAIGHPLDNEHAIRRYFEPSIAALMVEDQRSAARRGEVGTLNFDPFIDAQDWEISDFGIDVRDTAPGKASATVKFANLGEPRSVALELVKIKNDWRINDITWLRDGKLETLRGMYAH